MDCKNIIFTGHAIRQMFQREIAKDDVREIVDTHGLTPVALDSLIFILAFAFIHGLTPMVFCCF